MDNLEEIPIGGRYGGKGNYDVRFAKKLVQLVEEGLSNRAVCQMYKVSSKSLYRWIIKYGSAHYVQSIQRSISIQDKRTALRAIVVGNLTIKQAMAAYQVSDQTIRTWQKDYRENEELSFSNQQQLSKNKKRQHPDSKTEQVHQLQEQLAEAQLKIAALNTLIDVAEEQLKINIRKKPGARQSSE
jgi:transposase